MNAKAYNFTVVPGSIRTTTSSTGTKSFRTRVTTTLRGRQVERTLIASGKMHAALKGQLRKGREISLRCLISHAPGEDGKRGGEYLTAVAIPQPKAA